MVMPGDHIDMNVELITEIAMDEGLRFAIREGGTPSIELMASAKATAFFLF